MAEISIKRKPSRKELREDIIIGFVVVLFALFCLLPFITMFTASFSEEALIKEKGVALWLRGFSLDAYKYVFMYPDDIFHSYLISIIVLVIGTVLSITMSLSTAYAISRPYFKYRNIVGFFLFFTVLFNGGLIPTYILIKRYLHLYDTIWVLILPQLAQPTNIFLLKVFFGGLPDALFESAKLDGANETTMLVKIGAPLVFSGVITCLFYVVLAYWNDSFTPIIYIESKDVQPVQLLLQRMNDYIKFIQNNAQLGGGMAGNMEVPDTTIVYAISIVSTVPMMIVFASFQRFFVRGMTVGAVKG